MYDDLGVDVVCTWILPRCKIQISFGRSDSRGSTAAASQQDGTYLEGGVNSWFVWLRHEKAWPQERSVRYLVVLEEGGGVRRLGSE